MPKSDGDILVHPSSLSNYQDCARRSAIEIFREYEVIKNKRRKTFPTIGSLVGNGVHIGTALMLDATRGGFEPDLERAVQAGCDNYDDQSKDGVETDPTTRDRIQAHIQIKKMLEVMAYQLVPYEKFEQIEDDLTMHVDGRFYVTGRPDGRTIYGVVHDHKTGVKLSSHWSQLGGYSVLFRSHDLEVTGAQINFVKRVKFNKVQPDLETIPYDVRHAEDSYFQTIERIMDDHQKFERTNSMESFPANPASFMCSKKYCEAHSTPLCPYGKQSKNQEEYEVD